MDVTVTTKELWKWLVRTWIVLALVLGFMIYKDVRHDAAIKIAAITNTLQIHDQNFGAIKNSLENHEGRLQRSELAQQIQGNIVESGELDDQGQPVKK